MSQYRKKPVIVEAVQYDSRPMTEGFDHPGVCICEASPAAHLHTMHAGQFINLEIGDWIIPDGTPGTYYPCKPDIFAATYEPADAPPSLPVLPREAVVTSFCRTYSDGFMPNSRQRHFAQEGREPRPLGELIEVLLVRASAVTLAPPTPEQETP